MDICYRCWPSAKATGRGGGKKKGLGPRNDVLTTFKALILVSGVFVLTHSWPVFGCFRKLKKIAIFVKTVRLLAVFVGVVIAK